MLRDFRQACLTPGAENRRPAVVNSGKLDDLIVPVLVERQTTARIGTPLQRREDFHVKQEPSLRSGYGAAGRLVPSKKSARRRRSEGTRRWFGRDGAACPARGIEQNVLRFLSHHSAFGSGARLVDARATSFGSRMTLLGRPPPFDSIKLSASFAARSPIAALC